jgi:type I restriction enzyme S subunit
MNMEWEVVRLGDVCPEDKTLVHSKSSSKPYLGLEMIESETGIIDWTVSTVEGISTCYSFDSRHILYGKLRPYLNKVALPTIEGRCSTEIIPLLPNHDVSREYIAFLLRRKETIDYVMPENTGSRMPRADIAHLLNMEIPLPPIDTQHRIAAEIERQLSAVERAKRTAVEQLDAINALPAAILRQAFCGCVQAGGAGL